ncbi:hypothetical protein F5146DRAFT_664232 [Armillaria mellea]|nr:hypothetical protein F5146DRAFT_664232 [Armillaria mellea]
MARGLVRLLFGYPDSFFHAWEATNRVVSGVRSSRAWYMSEVVPTSLHTACMARRTGSSQTSRPTNNGHSVLLCIMSTVLLRVRFFTRSNGGMHVRVTSESRTRGVVSVKKGSANSASDARVMLSCRQGPTTARSHHNIRIALPFMASPLSWLIEHTTGTLFCSPRTQTQRYDGPGTAWVILTPPRSHLHPHSRLWVVLCDFMRGDDPSTRTLASQSTANQSVKYQPNQSHPSKNPIGGYN